MSIGRIPEFDQKTKNWVTYIARLEQFFIANDINDERKVPLLLTVVGDEMYELMVDLCNPEEPSDKTYDALVKLVKGHLNPKPSIIAERYKFRQRKQKTDESISQYVVMLKKLANTCDFGRNLDENLRDQLVFGLRNEIIIQRLFTEKAETLNFQKAYHIAVNIETAEKDAIAVEAGATVAHSKEGESAATVHKVQYDRKGKNSSTRSGKSHDLESTYQHRAPCKRCGRKNHDSSECFHKKAKCAKCGVIGHLKYVCRKNVYNNAKQYFLQPDVNHADSDSDECSFYNLEDDHESDKPICVIINIENKRINMEIDTGSGISIISYNMYCKMFPNIILQASNLKLKIYTGEKILPNGFIIVNAEYNGKQEMLKLYVVNNGGPPLLGRSWCKKLNINIPVNGNTERVNAINVQQIMLKFLNEFPNVFAEGIGTLKKVKAHLMLKENSNPIFVKHRPLPFAMKEKIDKELDRLVFEGILTPIEHSLYGTPIVPVIKKDSTVRICGDFRITINPLLKVNQYPLPRIEELFTNLQGGKIFSKIDLSQAYAQVLLDDESKKYCTISTHRGLFMYNRLPYGIASAPSIFQKIIDDIFKGFEGVSVFLDDILITGSNEIDHLNKLRNVFNKLNDMGLRVKWNKCTFFVKSVSYLGYIIDAEGLHTDKLKVEAIIKSEKPNNVTELKSLLGFINYYGKFVKNLSLNLNPLFQLLKKDVHWNWTNECDKAWEYVKKELVSSRVLVHYNPEMPLTLACDSSAYGVGAVISHIFPNGDSKPIAYASRTLSKSEINYSQIDKEALAIIFGIRKFHQFLYGRPFKLLTDHKPLVSIFGSKKGIPQIAASRLQRWSIILSAYNYEIEFVNSKDNANADALSRLPIKSRIDAKDDYGHIFYFEESIPISHKIIAKETKKDTILNMILNYSLSGWPKESDSEEIKPYFFRRDQIHVEHGCLLWGFRVIIPRSVQSKILDEIHASHMGVNRCKSIARSYVWWPLLDNQIENLCKNCNACNAVRQLPPKSSLHVWKWPDNVWERLHIDFLGPIANHKYLVVIDAHSKWLEMFKMQNTTAQTTITALRSLFSRFGIPKYIVSDNGPPFCSSELNAYFQINGITHICTTPYHPASNGQAENAVKTTKNFIKKFLYENKNVDVGLQRFLFDYRNTEHATTLKSPAELMFGRRLRCRLDLLKPRTADIVKNNQNKQIKNYGGKKREVKIGEDVLVRDFSNSKRPGWIRGNVSNQTGDVNYEISVDDKTNKFRRHIDQILPIKLRNSLAAGNVEVENTVSSQDNENLDINDINCVPSTSAPRYNLRPRK